MPLRYMAMDDGQVREQSAEIHDFWIVVTQDCDLAWSALVENDEFLVELRPILPSETEPVEWGLRGHRLRLHEDGKYVDNRTPRLMVTSTVVAASTFVEQVPDARVRALKTWLGRRYDRPALPGAYVELAKQLVSVVTKRKNRATANKLRDILATFDKEDGDTVIYKLVAVLSCDHESAVPDGTRGEIEEWLSGVGLEISTELGVLGDFDVLAADEVDLDLLENSYSLDASRLTWPSNSSSPVGEE